jgi:2-oxoisovalerate dehydrogenase E2 component (dihydrolipoyl transacylase)
VGQYVFKLPDVGEGTAEAEIVAWHVRVGDVVKEDAPLVDVMTDKATVEMTAPVSGKVIAIHGEPGDMAPVGGAIAVFETDAEEAEAPAPAQQEAKPAPKPNGGDAAPAETCAAQAAHQGARRRHAAKRGARAEARTAERAIAGSGAARAARAFGEGMGPGPGLAGRSRARAEAGPRSLADPRQRP